MCKKDTRQDWHSTEKRGACRLLFFAGFVRRSRVTATPVIEYNGGGVSVYDPPTDARKKWPNIRHSICSKKKIKPARLNR
ncbi:hypothetical protein COEREDRAFT_82259 [Coemansia reversa NRRL 1564]|uniref:Uncharacterized protein n=1 Tax=Coemansia reversa (strain ATCC 12441 / NRRL 1564) TaxID=763665 RepID=A0A2G5B7R5_COERN|nr:hypothetical protein COEREDRAFT_82259 [Coemansia reversa NRRL 1564]|eukprot:PIA15049.1 hypothetical protein COEREDRAFT_82259 [Coemansia reversa NRRL 1564]